MTETAMSNATSLTSWTNALKITLDQQGVDSERLFQKAGLDAGLLSDANARYPLAGTTKLWALARAASGDEAIGLNTGRNIRQTTFHALGYALLVSENLADCFGRLLRYFRIVSDAAELEFQIETSLGRFCIHPLAGDEQPAVEAIDAMMSVVIRLCRSLYGADFRAREISFRREAPEQPMVFEKVFKAPLNFAAERNEIVIDEALLQRPLPTANQELAQVNEAVLIKHLAKLDSSCLADRVVAVLREQLPHGEPSQDKVAAQLNMSLRNLQRRLKEEGESYSVILNNARRELADSYLQSGYSVSETTFLLGFSDTSSFSRAYKRWTGESPSKMFQSV